MACILRSSRVSFLLLSFGVAIVAVALFGLDVDDAVVGFAADGL